LGIGPNPQSPIPQTPTPNPKKICNYKKNNNKKHKKKIKNNNKKFNLKFFHIFILINNFLFNYFKIPF